MPTEVAKKNEFWKQDSHPPQERDREGVRRVEETVAFNGALSRIESRGDLMGQDRVKIFHLGSAVRAQWREKGFSPWFGRGCGMLF
jgi:hypothetical protein